MEEKKNEGITVKEIEQFAKKHRFEVLFGLSFVFACFFSFVFFGAGWAIIFAMIGGILGVIIPGRVETYASRMFQFVFKQEQTTQLVLSIVMLIISIFLPPLIFLIVGAQGGQSLRRLVGDLGPQNK